MSTELARQSLAVNPATGEQIDLAGETQDLARALYEIRQMEGRVRDLKGAINEELLRRMDRDALWTIHLEGSLTASAPSSEDETAYDELTLRESLLELADDGLITVEAVDRAVETVVTYKVSKRGLNALRKVGGVVAQVIDAHTHHRPKARYVNVKAK